MNYELITTEHIDGVEYVMLFDKQQGVAYRIPIYTQGMRDKQPERANMPPIVPYVPPSNVRPVLHNEPVPTFHGAPLPDRPNEVIISQEELPRQRSIIPPHLAGVMIKEGHPGAAVEQRDT